MPLTHPPGHAQADSGEAMVVIGGVLQKIHYLFEDRFERPCKGNDKGKVEGLVGFIRQNFLVPIPRAESFEALNAALAELELIDRERRMVERRIKAARFPVIKSLDAFDFKAIPSLIKALVLELARCEYIKRRENLIALGKRYRQDPRCLAPNA